MSHIIISMLLHLPQILINIKNIHKVYSDFCYKTVEIFELDKNNVFQDHPVYFLSVC